MLRLRLPQPQAERIWRRLGRIEFCDQCASVCDAHCRATALRDQTTLHALRTERPGL